MPHAPTALFTHAATFPARSLFPRPQMRSRNSCPFPMSTQPVSTTTVRTNQRMGGRPLPRRPHVYACFWFYQPSERKQHQPVRVVPRTRFGKDLKRHHTLHHLKDETCWLAFTAPPIDTLLGTVPPQKERGSPSPVADARARSSAGAVDVAASGGGGGGGGAGRTTGGGKH